MALEPLAREPGLHGATAGAAVVGCGVGVVAPLVRGDHTVAAGRIAARGLAVAGEPILGCAGVRATADRWRAVADEAVVHQAVGSAPVGRRDAAVVTVFVRGDHPVPTGRAARRRDGESSIRDTASLSRTKVLGFW